MFDVAGTLLYVGISYRVGARWDAESRAAEWWPRVQRQTVEWYGSRAEAGAAESAAVKREKPLFNRMLVGPEPALQVEASADVNAPRGEFQAAIAARLRELRSAAGIGSIEAGRRAGMSQSKVSRLERRQSRPTPGDIRILCKVYGASATATREMVGLAEFLLESIDPPRVVLARNADRVQGRIRRLEDTADLVRDCQPTVVPDFLQTEDYARLFLGSFHAPGGDVERTVKDRLERQAALRARGCRMVLVITEGTLLWQAGGPGVMLDQIDAIRAAAELPNVEFGIIPFTAPAVGLVLEIGFRLYDSHTVVVETESGTAVLSDSGNIARYEETFAHLVEIASTGDAARAVLDRIASVYKGLSRANSG